MPPATCSLHALTPELGGARCDFVYDNIIEMAKANGAKAGLAAVVVLAICVRKDMIWGSLLGIAGTQAYGYWQRQQLQRE